MTKETSNYMTPVEIKSLIYVIRGKQIMLDSDLAMLYQVETKRINEAVKRNLSRFPERFCFQVSKEEYENLKSQFATSSLEENSKHGGRRTLPYAFTEQGIAMLSSVLKSDVAVQVSIRIMDTFVEMRKYMANMPFLYEKVHALETRQYSYQAITNQKFEEVFHYIATHEKVNQKIFYDGQIFDAYSLLIDIVQKAKHSIILIDGYVDINTLNILSKKNNGVNVEIYTYPNAKVTMQDIINFNAQYPTLEVRRTTVFHDRFILLDDVLGYHIGASIKDAGKKCFGINRIEDKEIIKRIIQRAEAEIKL